MALTTSPEARVRTLSMLVRALIVVVVVATVWASLVLGPVVVMGTLFSAMVVGSLTVTVGGDRVRSPARSSDGLHER